MLKPKKLLLSLIHSIFLLLTFFSICLAKETLTITTYYPSPYGSYNELRTYSNTYLAISSGSVGIGTTSPVAKLQISGNITNNFPRPLYIQMDSGANLLHTAAFVNASGYGVGIGAYDADTFGTISAYRFTNGFGTSFVPLILNREGANVGIGTTSPSYQLQLSTDSAAKPSTNTWTIVSDRRVKKDIRPYTNSLSIVKRINPVWFKYNGKAGFPEGNQEHIGVIGQEIAKVAPYTVNTFWAKLNPEDKEPTELLNFNSHALTFDLINAVKELDSNITKLSQENQELKETNKELKSEMENLKTRLSRLEARMK